MDNEIDDPRPRSLPLVVSGFLVFISIATRTSVAILQKDWTNFYNDQYTNYTNFTNCNTTVDYGQIDPFFTLLMSECFAFIFFGTLFVFYQCPCFNLITSYEVNYEKSQFALIGSSNIVSVLCFMYAQSGCRTPPYLQAVLLNLMIPAVFILRLIALRKRPTCRKLLCALLVLFAQYTLLIPMLFPSLKDESIYPISEDVYGHTNALWVLCFFFGIIPAAVSFIFSEKTVKVIFPHRNQPDFMNMIYFLYWSYFFSLLTLLFLFWTDCVPGFGMYSNIPMFGKGIWFNVKCFFGYEGCTGGIHVISSICIVLIFINRLTNVYILRYMEGANFLVLISALPTPLLYIFLTLFDEKTLKWHPHAYLSTWISIAALCIIIPAIYIYSTGAPEKVPSKKPLVYCIDHGIQTVGYQGRPSTNSRDSFVQCDNTDTDDETCRLLVDSQPPPYRVQYNAFQQREVTSHSVAVGADNSFEENEETLSRGDNSTGSRDYPARGDSPVENSDYLNRGVNSVGSRDYPARGDNPVASRDYLTRGDNPVESRDYLTREDNPVASRDYLARGDNPVESRDYQNRGNNLNESRDYLIRGGNPAEIKDPTREENQAEIVGFLNKGDNQAESVWYLNKGDNQAENRDLNRGDNPTESGDYLARGDNSARSFKESSHVKTCPDTDIDVSWLLDDDNKLPRLQHDGSTEESSLSNKKDVPTFTSIYDNVGWDDDDDDGGDINGSDGGDGGVIYAAGNGVNDDARSDGKVNGVVDEDERTDIYMNDLVGDDDDSDTNHLLSNIPVIVCSPASNHGFVHD